MKKVQELNKLEDWVWEDRNCIDAYSYIVGQKAVVNDSNYDNILSEHTRLVSCGVWMDPPISLICEHHLKRAREATNCFGYLISRMLATFPSIFEPTIVAVETVKKWYSQNGIPFFKY